MKNVFREQRREDEDKEEEEKTVKNQESISREWAMTTMSAAIYSRM